MVQALRTVATLATLGLLACGTSAPPRPVPAPVAPRVDPPAPEAGDVTRTTTSGAVTYTYRASRMTYLVYAIDCLAELIACSKPEVAAEWKTAWSAADDAALATWRALRQRYSGEITDGERQPTAVLPVAYHPRDIGSAIRIAAFGARDVDDAASRLSLFLGAAEVVQARAVLARFSARADERWRAGRAALATSLGDYVALGERAEVQALLAQIARFYAIGDRGAHQTFDLVLRPPGTGPTSAQQLGELAIVEVVRGEPASSRYPVIAHEMFHAWFGASPIEAQDALVARFLATKDPLVGPAWGLLDEVLATALGNGLVARLVDRADYERRLAKDLGFYNDPFIDKVAKALLPALEKRLAGGGSVFDAGFVADYLAAVHAAFPSGMPPSAYLRPLFVAAPGPGSDTLIERSNAGYVESYDDLAESAAHAARLAHWGTALFSAKADLDRLSPFLPRAALAAAKREKASSFVFVQTHAPVGTVFLFVGATPADYARLVDALFALPAPLREGVILR